MKSLSEAKNIFEQELNTLYTPSEIQGLFQIFMEEKTGLTAVEQRIQASTIYLNNDEDVYFNTIIKELKKGKPYQQILGYADFYGLKFHVNEHVLIPRPETEEVLELAIKKIKSKHGNDKELKILDIGTGSGIIPIMMKLHFPKSEVTAIDISEEALLVATQNAQQHMAEINFVQLDYLNNDLDGHWDIILSNPPYIGIHEKDEIDYGVKSFEPNIALFSPNSDTLIFYRKIAKDAKQCLNPDGMIFLEINQKLGPETLELFSSFPEKQLIKDISGNDRIIFVG